MEGLGQVRAAARQGGAAVGEAGHWGGTSHSAPLTKPLDVSRKACRRSGSRNQNHFVIVLCSAVALPPAKEIVDDRHVAAPDLEAFRSLRSATVEFDNPTFLVGQNGAGKSNIVDALSLLADAMASPLSAVLDKRGGIGAVGHRSASRGRVADTGLRVELEGLAGMPEAMYAFEVRATKDYGYEVHGEQCRCVAEDGTRGWFHRDIGSFRSNIKALPAPAPNALALPLVASDERLAPVAQFLSDIQPYRIDPRSLREMQDPDAGVRLRSDGGNAASVLRQLAPDSRQHLQEFLQTVVPGEVEVGMSACRTSSRSSSRSKGKKVP